MREWIEIVEGDITRLDVEAIVNAANRSLLGGGGVDGAIHRAAGRDLYEACKTLGGCDTGEAKITPGFKLPARYVIHTVGPVWGGGQRGEDALLASCYRNALALATRHGLASIAYPAISTGAFGFPPDRAASIAMKTVLAALGDGTSVEKIVFCCFGPIRTYHKHFGRHHDRVWFPRSQARRPRGAHCGRTRPACRACRSTLSRPLTLSESVSRPFALSCGLGA